MEPNRKPISTNIIWNWVRYGFAILIGLYLTPFILSRLGVSSFGAWVLLGAILGYAGLFNFGIESGIVRYLSSNIAERDMNSAEKVIQTAGFLFNILGILVFIVCLPLAAGFYFKNDLLLKIFNIPDGIETDFGTLLLILSTGLAVSFFSRVHLGILKASERYDLVNRIEILIQFFRALFILLFMNDSLIRLGIIFAAFNILQSIAYITAAHQILQGKDHYRKRFHAGQFRLIGKFGFYTFLTTIADQVRFNTDAIVINIFMPSRFITYFNLGNRLIEYFKSFIGNFTAPFFPAFSRMEGRGDLESISRSFMLASKITAYMAGIIGGIIIGTGKPFLHFWIGSSIGDEYVKLSYQVLVILLVPYVFALMQSVSISAIYGLGKPHFLTQLAIGEATANLVLSVLLVKEYGILGVAAGTAIPMLITKLLIQPFYVCRLIKITVPTFILKVMFPTLCFGTILGGAQLMGYSLISTHSLTGMIIINMITVMPAALAGFNIYFSHEERDKIRSILMRMMGKTKNA